MNQEKLKKSIKSTSDKLISKHRRMINKYSHEHNPVNMDNLAIRHAIVSVNQILSIIGSDWGIMYWGEVKKYINLKIQK